MFCSCSTWLSRNGSELRSRLAGLRWTELHSPGTCSVPAERATRSRASCFWPCSCLTVQPMTVAEVTVHVGDRTQRWEADMSALRRWSEEQDQLTKHAKFCEALATVHRDGGAHSPEMQSRHVASGTLAHHIQAANGVSAAVLSSSHAFRSVARNTGDEELEECLSSLASGLSGRMPEAWASAVNQLAVWLSRGRRVEPFDDDAPAA